MARIEDAIERMRELLAAPHPGMRCEGTVGGEEEVRVFACRHEAGPPAGKKELDRIREAVGPEAASDFAKFYAAFGELTLYRNTEQEGGEPFDETALIHFAPVEEWDALKEGLETWLEGLEEEDYEEDEEGLEAGEAPRSVFRSAVPFAQVPHSADVIFVVDDGDYAGQVFQLDHETLAPMHRASSLAELVEVIASDTDTAVEWFGDSIRYCKGKTQWFPVGVARSREGKG